MGKYASCYDPPLNDDLAADREVAWANAENCKVYLHIGFFIYWYASVEGAVTLLLMQFTGKQHPTQFHVLTRGMDAKLKSERLKEAAELAKCSFDPALAKRFEHFTKRLSGIRNQLVHNYPFFRDDTFQLVSIGAPPHIPDQPLKNAPKPLMISSLELYERGKWLQAFSNDLYKILDGVKKAEPSKHTLGRETYWSSLPSGDRPSLEKQARRASADKGEEKVDKLK